MQVLKTAGLRLALIISDATFISKHILLFDLRTITALLAQSDTNFAIDSNNLTYDFSTVAVSANTVSIDWLCIS